MLAPKKLCPTPGSLYPVYTASMIKPIRKATPLLVHVRPYPILKASQPYKGTHAYTNWFRHLIVQKIKYVASNQNSVQEETLPKNCQRSKGPRGPSYLDCQDCKIIKRTRCPRASSRSLHCQKPSFPRSCISCIVKGPLLEPMNPML